MTVDELYQYKWLMREIDRIDQELAVIEAGGTLPGCETKISEYPNRDITAELYDILIIQRSKAAERVNAVRDYINSISDPITHKIMILKFVDCLTTSAIANQLNYETSAVLKRISRAMMSRNATSYCQCRQID